MKKIKITIKRRVQISVKHTIAYRRTVMTPKQLVVGDILDKVEDPQINKNEI